MATKVIQNILYLSVKGDVDLDSDTLFWILMDTGFAFDQSSHHQYSDVSASELGAGNGYTQFIAGGAAGKEAAGISISRDDSLYKLTVTWSNPQWTASGGTIGPTPGAFLLDDDVADDPLLMYIDFNGEGSEADGGVFTIASPKLEITTAAA